MVVKAEKPVNCTIIGDAMIGKSTLVKAFMDNDRPDTSYVATILETYEGMYSFCINIHINAFDMTLTCQWKL